MFANQTSLPISTILTGAHTENGLQPQLLLRADWLFQERRAGDAPVGGAASGQAIFNVGDGMVIDMAQRLGWPVVLLCRVGCGLFTSWWVDEHRVKTGRGDTAVTVPTLQECRRCGGKPMRAQARVWPWRSSRIQPAAATECVPRGAYRRSTGSDTPRHWRSLSGNIDASESFDFPSAYGVQTTVLSKVGWQASRHNHVTLS